MSKTKEERKVSCFRTKENQKVPTGKIGEKFYGIWLKKNLGPQEINKTNQLKYSSKFWESFLTKRIKKLKPANHSRVNINSAENPFSFLRKEKEKRKKASIIFNSLEKTKQNREKQRIRDDRKGNCNLEGQGTSKVKIEILSWNCRSLTNEKAVWALNQCKGILILQEIWKPKKSITSILGTNSAINVRTQDENGGGTLINLPNNYEINRICKEINQDSILAKIIVAGNRYRITS